MMWANACKFFKAEYKQVFSVHRQLNQNIFDSDKIHVRHYEKKARKKYRVVL